MGLSQSLWTGLTTLKSHQTWTDVISNNLSQANTDGFKYSDVSFNDILYGKLSGGSKQEGNRGSTNPRQVGNGVGVGTINQVFSPGGMTQTSRTFDCAIDGNGFFVLGGLNNSRSDYYTKNGQFLLSAPLSGNPLTQNLLSADGLIVQGYQAIDGVLSDVISDITLPTLSTHIDGEVTSTLTFSGNLNSNVSVLQGNDIPTSSGNVTAGSWLSNTGSDINVGGVESTGSLFDKTSSATADGTTDLANISFQRGTGSTQNLFGNIPNGYTMDSRELTVEFTKGSHNYTETFVYGTDGTTLDDFAAWLAGGVGDSGTASTQRLDGGIFGTVRTREYTVDGDGYAAPAEQAGSYFGYDDDGNFNLNIASNLGQFNTISDIRISTSTMVTDPSTGESRNLQSYYEDFFQANPAYTEDDTGGSGISLTEVYLPSSVAGEGTVEESERVNYTLISRDSNGSTWRWFADGDFESTDDSSLNKGTGIIRFGTSSQSGEQQVIDSTIDGGTTYTMDFSAMTQLAIDNTPQITQDGYPDGELDSYLIDQYGVIDGHYTNGLNQHLAKLAMAVIPNENGMSQVGNTLWTTNGISGSPVYNSTENINLFGSIRSHTLESSNVVMAKEMTKLLMSQRGYQLGSKVITTADDMLQEAVNMKR